MMVLRLEGRFWPRGKAFKQANEDLRGARLALTEFGLRVADIFSSLRPLHGAPRLAVGHVLFRELDLLERAAAVVRESERHLDRVCFHELAWMKLGRPAPAGGGS